MLHNWLRGWKQQQEMTLRGRGMHRRRQRKDNVRLHLEPLEDRTLLSVTPSVSPWISQGPGPIQDNAQSDVNGFPWPLNANGQSLQAQIGAIESVAVAAVPNSNHFIVYAGTVNGGVWRAGFVSGGNWIGDITPDMLSVIQVPDGVNPDGSTKYVTTLAGNPTTIEWQNMSDSQASLAISSLALDPNDKSGNRLWAGTGNMSSASGSGGAAIGLLKTTDGGLTWSVLGGADLGGEPIVSVVPTTLSDPGQVVLVAALGGKGIMRSHDGGQTFQPVNAVDLNGNLVQLTGNATDVIADPNNPERFYASVFHFGGEQTSGVFESDDGGTCWNEMAGDSSLTQITAATDLKFAVQVNGRNTLLFVATGDTNGQISGAFDALVPTGGGVTQWQPLGSVPIGIAPGNPPYVPPENWQNFAAAADPTAPGVFYVAGFQGNAIFRIDGGDPAAMPTKPPAWVELDKPLGSNPSLVNNTNPHDDERHLAFLGSSLIVANDGGIYGLESPTQAGQSSYQGRWVSLNANLRDTELFNAQFDPRNNTIFGGAQDNGTPFTVYDTFPVQSGMELGGNSDGGPSAMGKDHAYYSRANYGDFYYDNGTKLPAPPDGSGGWFTNMLRPVGASPVLPGQLMLQSNAGNLYEITISTNSIGNTIVTMTHVTPKTNTGGSDISGNVSAIAYGVNNGNAAYFGTSGSQVFYRSTSGPTFQATQYAGAGVVEIAVDPYDSATAYVLDANGVMWRTQDAGMNWDKNLTEDLSNIALDSNGNPAAFVADTLALCDPNPTQAGQGALIIGGLGRVYSLPLANPSAGWQTVGQGLPNVLVTDVHYVQPQDLLLVGTFGRGAWTMAHASGTLLNPLSVDLTVTDDDASHNQVLIRSVPGFSEDIEISVNNRVEFTGPWANVDSITVNESSASDMVDIEVNSSTPITVNLGVGTDVVNIDSLSKIYNLTNFFRQLGVSSDVTVHGGSGFDTLSVYDHNDSGPPLSWAVSNSRISNSKFAGAAVDSDHLSSINLFGGTGSSYTINGTSGSISQGTTIVGSGGANTFAVQATDAPLTIDSNGSNDTVNIVESVATINSIVGPLIINGNGHTTLYIADTGYVAAFGPVPLGYNSALYIPELTNYTFTHNVFHDVTVFNRILFGGLLPEDSTGNTLEVFCYHLARLQVDDSPHTINANSFSVLATDLPTQVILGANRSQDSVQMGSRQSALSNIGNVTINGAGDTAVTLDDEATAIQNFTRIPILQQDGSCRYLDIHIVPRAVSYVLNSAGISRNGLVTSTSTFEDNGQPDQSFPNGTLSYAMNVVYNGVSSLHLNGGSTTNTFNVFGNQVALGITAGSGGDSIVVGDATRSLNEVVGVVKITGNTGTQLILDDRATQNVLSDPLPAQGFDGFTDLNHPVYSITDQQTCQQIERKNTDLHTDFPVDPKGNLLPPKGPYALTFLTTVTYTNVASLEVDGANLLLTNHNGANVLLAQDSTSNVFDVEGVPAGTNVSITAGDGSDTIKLGPSLDAVAGTVHVTGSTGTQLILDDRATQNVQSDPLLAQGFDGFTDLNHPVYSITDQQTYQQVERTNTDLHTDFLVDSKGNVTKKGPHPLTFLTTVRYTNVASLEVDGANLLLTNHNGVMELLPQDSTSNVFDVEGVSAGTNASIQTGDGLDQVNIGSDPVNLSQSRVDAIQGQVTIVGQGQDILNYTDTGAAPNGRYLYSVEAGSIQRTGTSKVMYSDVASVNLYAANVPDGFNLPGIESTAPGTTYNIYAGIGENEFIVDDFGDTLNGIQGPLFLHGIGSGPSYNSFVKFDDQLNTTRETFLLSSGTTSQSGIVQRFTFGTTTPDMATINYDGMNGGSVLATDNAGNSDNSAGNTVNVQSEAPNLFTVVEAGTGDVVTVGSRAPSLGGNLSSIQGDIRIQAVIGQTPRVILDDSGHSTSRTVGLAGDPFFGYIVNGFFNSSLGRGRIGLALDPKAQVSLLGGTGDDVYQIHDFTNAPAISIDAETAGSTRTNQHNKLDYSGYTGDVDVLLSLGHATGFTSIAHVQDVAGGIGNSMLVGDAKPNILTGGTGRNILIGGLGADTVTGGGGDNILIGGYTKYDQDLIALQAIRSEWTNTADSYAKRVKAISNGVVGSDGNWYALVGGKGKAATVFDDGLADILTANPNPSVLDWLFVGLNDLVNSRKKDTITAIF
jgi:hypothetical protein